MCDDAHALPERSAAGKPDEERDERSRKVQGQIGQGETGDREPCQIVVFLTSGHPACDQRSHGARYQRNAHQQAVLGFSQLEVVLECASENWKRRGCIAAQSAGQHEQRGGNVVSLH